MIKVLGGFAKLRKATISFVMSVRANTTNCMQVDGFSLKSDIQVLFAKLSKKFKFHSNLTGITGLYMQTNVHC